MPQKAQLLLQIAQAAARVEGRQQALPQLAVNAWETLAGGHAPPAAGQHPQQRPQLGLGQQHPQLRPGDRLGGGLGRLGHLGPAAAGAYAYGLPPPHLLGGAWGAPAPLAGGAAAGAFYDARRPGAVLGGLGPAAPRARTPPPRGAPLGGLQLGGRKPRFNNSIGLNKQIMGTHCVRDLATLVRAKGPSFDFFNISSAIARVPKLVGPAGGVQNDPTAKSLVDDLAALMATHINTFDARGLANSAWAFGKLKYAPPSSRLPSLIAAAALEKLPGFSAQNLSNLLWSFVYLHHRDEQLLAAASAQVVAKIDEFKPQELANVVWALASMEHYEPCLMEVVARRALSLSSAFKEQELSNILWAFAKLHHYDDALFAHLLGAVAAKLPHFLPQGVSNIAWALATAGHRDDGLFEHLLGHCLADMGAYDVQGLVNLLWACATLGHRDDVFVSAALQECGARLERMSSQNLSNALWAWATLGAADGRMLGAWADAVLRKLELFEPQGLSNTAWAFARLGFSGPALFDALAGAARGKLDAFSPQALANTAWAFATVGHYDPALVAQLAEQAARQAGGFGAQHVANTLWALSTLRHYHAGAYDALLERLAAQLCAAEPQHVASALWAVARVGHPLGGHGGALVAAAKRLLPAMKQQELCNAVWALGVLGELDVATWEQFVAFLANVQGLTPEGVAQAFHAQLMLHSAIARAGGGAPPESLPSLPEPLGTHARHMWLTSAVDVRVSKLQADVSAALLLGGICNSLEWLTDDGLFSIDIAFQVDGQPVAVEVDGAHHYTRSAPPRPLSEVAVRRRLLQDRGWKVVNLGYQEWEALPADPYARAAALLQRVAAELGPHSSWTAVGPPAVGAAAQPGAAPRGAEDERAALACAGAWQLGGDAAASAAAAAAVAGAVGGDFCGGLVLPRDAGGVYGGGAWPVTTALAGFDFGALPAGWTAWAAAEQPQVLRQQQAEEAQASMLRDVWAAAAPPAGAPRAGVDSPGGSSSGSGEGRAFRMPSFMWADPVASSIWGPAAQQQAA
ncbi:hypothetical protein HT031_003135 [Scenedesmus sp. PABB004]|nr:hypothetical protein HT031_003135 [Scenedesmus sp. PABB004]